LITAFSPLQHPKPIIFPANDSVAFAGRAFQVFVVQDLNFAAGVFNQFGALQQTAAQEKQASNGDATKVGNQ
jgi:hypothetical protein